MGQEMSADIVILIVNICFASAVIFMAMRNILTSRAYSGVMCACGLAAMAILTLKIVEAISASSLYAFRADHFTIEAGRLTDAVTMMIITSLIKISK